MSAITLIACLDLALWLYLLLAHGGFWRICLGEDAPAPAAWPSVCAVIPARNEADILPQTLPTLLAHDYPGPLSVVLVDDRSEDATAAVAEKLGGKVVSGRAMPGWKGKVAAMQRGLDEVSASGTPPSYILFTDADIAYDKGAFARLVACAEAGGLVLASLMVKLRCKSMAERWLIPAFVYFFQLLYPFRRVNDPRKSLAAAAGGCMLVRYDALMKAGGMAPIRTALIDDCALGRLMKAQGPISLALTDQVHSMRPYPRLSDIRAMVARSAYDQLGYSPLNLTGALLGMLLIYIAPVLLALFGSGMARFLGLASWAIMSITFIPMSRFYNRPPLSAAALPAIAACYMAFTLESAWAFRQGKGGLWKGRAQATGTGA